MLSNGFYKIIRYCTSIMLYYITLSFCNIIILVLLVLLVPSFFNGVATDCFIEIRGIRFLLKSVPDLFDTIMKNLPTTASSIFFYFGNFSAPPVDKETFIILAVLETNYLVMPTRDGPSCQSHGLEISSRPAPPISNIWISK